VKSPSLTIHYHHVHHDPGAPILEVEKLTVIYDNHVALENMTFHLHAGERVAVVGPNGAGKSSLFKVVAGVLPPSAGAIRVSGFGPRGHICIAYVPQRTQVDWRFPASVADVVMMGRIGQIGFFHWPSRNDWHIVNNALDSVDLLSLANSQIGDLSGGQQQRAFLARALAQNAELVLMDEPLNGLDAPSQEVILSLLGKLSEQKITIMVATHDLGQAANYFDRVLLMNRKLIRFGRPGEVLTSENLLLAYEGHAQMIRNEDGSATIADSCCGGGEQNE
jgi:manganese/iron transport system ATP-binding protein